MLKNKAIIAILFFLACLLMLLIYNQRIASKQDFANEIIINLEDAEKLNLSVVGNNSKNDSKYGVYKYNFPLPHIETRSQESRIVSIGEQTAFGNNIYYKIMHDIPMSNVADAADIFALDRNSGNIQLIYQTDSNFETGWICDFKCNDKYLFWLHFYGTIWRIYKMPLTSPQPILVKEGGGTILPSLSVSNEYVSWFEKDDKNSSPHLMLYSINEDQTMLVSANPTLKSPYKRADIRGNHLTYLSEDPRGIKIKILNLNEMSTREILLPKDARVEDVYSNGHLTVWYENFKKSAIFVYDHLERKLYTMEEHIFSLDLIDQSIFVNTRDKIIVYDFNDKSKHILTESNPEQRYYMAIVTSDNNFIAFNNAPDNAVETTIIEPSYPL